MHLGYFVTRDDAERWLKILHPHYPHAFVEERQKLVPHCVTDSHEDTDMRDLPVEEDALGQPVRPLPNPRSWLS